jgi:hypothetical protein
VRRPATGDFCLMPEQELRESCELIAAIRLSAERARGEAIALVEESREHLRRVKENGSAALSRPGRRRHAPRRSLEAFIN